LLSRNVCNQIVRQPHTVYVLVCCTADPQSVQWYISCTHSANLANWGKSECAPHQL